MKLSIVVFGMSLNGAGKIQYPLLDICFYICLKFDLKTSEIEANVNGRLIGRVHGKNMTNKPNKLGIRIGLGHYKKQFQGSMTNIKVLREVDASNISSAPCKYEQDDLLS